jgi:propionate CoA-transferase
VFELRPEGLVLTELAPGVDLERDVIANMGFRPILADQVRTMDPALFKSASLALELAGRN